MLKVFFRLYRLFLYENVPQLKYHNPAVEFVVKQQKADESAITFEFGKWSLCPRDQFMHSPHTHMTYSLCYEDDGGAHKMATTGLRQKAIQETLQSVLNNNTLSSNDHLLTNE